MRLEFSVVAGKFESQFLVVLEEGRCSSTGITTATIYGQKADDFHDDFSFFGMAKCSPEDTFSQKRGFILAFKRATDDIKSKAVRTELWKRFHEILNKALREKLCKKFHEIMNEEGVE